MWGRADGGGTETATLRRWILAAQAGSREDHVALLRWAADRGRSRWTDAGDAEAAVQAALRLLHALRGTYDPRRCALRWVDTVLDMAAPHVGR
jgi:hypothetical protein